ncbi:hypothetical protein RFI_32156, partial [Reticulomyxa filosa]
TTISVAPNNGFTTIKYQSVPDIYHNFIFFQYYYGIYYKSQQRICTFFLNNNNKRIRDAIGEKMSRRCHNNIQLLLGQYLHMSLEVMMLRCCANVSLCAARLKATAVRVQAIVSDRLQRDTVASVETYVQFDPHKASRNIQLSLIYVRAISNTTSLASIAFHFPVLCVSDLFKASNHWISNIIVGMMQPGFSSVYGTLSEAHVLLTNLSQEDSQKVFTIPQSRNATGSVSGNSNNGNRGDEKDNDQQLHCLEKKGYVVVSKPVSYMSAILANGQTQMRKSKKKRNDTAIANVEQSIETCKSEQKKVVEGSEQIEETENQLNRKKQSWKDPCQNGRNTGAVDRCRENDTKQEHIRSFCSERQKILLKMKKIRDNHIMQVQELEHHLK